MKKIILLIFFMLITNNLYAVPASNMSITPAAVDATTIIAADENTRNNAITTTFNAHDHNDIDQLGNTVSLGDATTGNKTIQANNADSSKPFIRYDDTNDRWVASRDGSGVQSLVLVTGPTVGHFILPQTLSEDHVMMYDSTGNIATSRWVAQYLDYAADTDNDTKIQLEESSDEDTIRMDTAGTERWILDSTGNRTLPTQPAFSVYLDVTQSNIATGSNVTVTFNTEIFDQNSDFNNATYTFTAPATGRYQFNVKIDLLQFDTAATSYDVILITSNRNYTFVYSGGVYAADGTVNAGFVVLADMDTSDTASVAINQTGGTQQTDIGGGGGASILSGFLAL